MLTLLNLSRPNQDRQLCMWAKAADSDNVVCPTFYTMSSAQIFKHTTDIRINYTRVITHKRFKQSVWYIKAR